jgi:hypothetical protein
MVADVLPQEEVGVEPPFFAIGLPKLAVMSICTFTLYQLYWFYQHWKRIAARERSTISPVARTIFTVVFCYSCFARIRDYDGSNDGTLSLLGRRDAPADAPRVGWSLPAAPLAIGWTVMNLVGWVSDAYSLISLLDVVFLLPVQAYANRLNTTANRSHHRNAQLTVWNWVGVTVGVLLLLSALLAPES